MTKETYHFYQADGTPCHGTIEDGLKANAFPSVTTVLSIIRKEFVESWKIREGIAASKLLPQHPGEDIKTYANRCISHNERMQGITTEFGTAIHASIEEFNNLHSQWKKGKIPKKPTAETACLGRPETLDWITHYVIWFYKHVDEVLISEGNSVSVIEGYAGQIDAVAKLLSGKTAILDFKTQKLKEKKPWGKPQQNKLALPSGPEGPETIEYWPASFYETWALQLCAYRKSLEEQQNILVDVVISVVTNSQEPGPIIYKIWDPKTYDSTYQVFLHTLKLWKWINNYYPQKP